MWRANALFGQSHHPDHHHPALNAAAHEGHTGLLGEHITYSLFGEAIVLCTACHAELQPHEFANGCCEDKDACAWRALSEHCCW